ncbi:MAG TPA: biopolymer transporter ExbD [Aquificaceae bacterium]|nr:biopolymer transporter ExbD [Aquificaceae bacterium]HIQ48124.1 biopolymer transporter ExbD [Aquifex aeolicus]
MNLRKKLRFREEEKAYIDVVPLVDTLLAVFLFLAILAFQSPETFIAIKLPFAETGESIQIKALKIQIDTEGKMKVKGKPISEEELIEMIKDIKPTHIVLEADENTKHKFVVKVMDIARKNGVENIVIAVRKKR